MSVLRAFRALAIDYRRHSTSEAGGPTPGSEISNPLELAQLEQRCLFDAVPIDVLDSGIAAGEPVASDAPIELGGLSSIPLPESVSGDDFAQWLGSDLGDAAHDVQIGNGRGGNDILVGTDRDDILDGGLGEDTLRGQSGDDLLLSRSDGGDPRAADASRVQSDDVLVGGEGADRFRFEAVVNAGDHVVQRHLNHDGTIHWRGIVQETDGGRSHWLEGLGDDVVWDFNRAEGDSIELAGHSIAVHLRHVDVNGDGALDASVLELYSDDRDGVHDGDSLGTVTVFGDLVMKSDLTVLSTELIGAADTPEALDQLATSVGGSDDPSAPVPVLDWLSQTPGTVLSLSDAVEFNGQDRLEVTHSPEMALAQGTFRIEFEAARTDGRTTLFSKDGFDHVDGHLSAFVRDGRIEVRLQTETSAFWLRSEAGTIQVGQRHDVVVTFGDNGLHLYLDGELVHARGEVTEGMDGNEDALVIGANTWGRSSERPNAIRDYFQGTIHRFQWIDEQLTPSSLAALQQDGVGSGQVTESSNDVDAGGDTTSSESGGSEEGQAEATEPEFSEGVVLHYPQFSFRGAEFEELPHADELALANGTITLEFSADQVNRRMTLFSKDAFGFGDGGHLSAYVVDGRVEVRIQSDTGSAWARSFIGSVTAGQDYQLAIQFGDDGLHVYLDGERVAWRPDFAQGIDGNDQSLVIGANTWGRKDGDPRLSDFFRGQISDFTIWDRVLDQVAITHVAQGTLKPTPIGGSGNTPTDGADTTDGDGQDAETGDDSVATDAEDGGGQSSTEDNQTTDASSDGPANGATDNTTTDNGETENPDGSGPTDEPTDDTDSNSGETNDPGEPLLATDRGPASLQVGQNQWVDYQGTVYSDENGNGVRDSYNSDGLLGWLVHRDVTDIDWAAHALGADVDFAQTQVVQSGETAIAARISQPGSYGFKFVYDGEAVPLDQVDALQFSLKASRADTNLRLRLVGTDGATSQGGLSVSASDWQDFRIELSQFAEIGDIREIQFLFNNSAAPYTVYADEILFEGEAPVTEPPSLDDSPNWGVNLFSHEDYTSDGAFANVVSTFRRWGKLYAGWSEDSSLSYGEQGIPLDPSSAITHLNGYEPGLYQLRYEGTGTISLQMGAAKDGTVELVPGSWRTEGNETVAEFYISNTGVPVMLNIEANEAGDNVRNLQLLAPGYHGADAPTYRDEFIDRLQPFGALRFMDYSVTNNSDVTNWSDRRLPTDSIQTSQHDSGARGGVAWEHLIEMSNQAQVDAWINVPHLADADYVTELAKLWHEGLDPNLNVIVEFSNEVWNPLFSQYRETNNGDYGGVIGPKLVEIRQAFDDVWGADRDRVEVVLAGQAVNQGTMNHALNHIADFVDANPNDAYDRVSDVIDAMSIAMYVNVDQHEVYSNADEIMDSLLDLSDEVAFLNNFQHTAESYGLKMYGYEGGQHLRASQTTYRDLVDLVQSDERMAQLQAEYAKIWQEAGGDLFMHYTLTGNSLPSSQWGLLESIDLPGSVRWDSAMSILLDEGDANLDGEVTYEDFKILEQHYGQSAWWEQGDFDASRTVDDDDLDLLWRNLDQSRLTVGQRNEIMTFADVNGVSLATESLTIQLSSNEVLEDLTSSSTGVVTVTVERSGDLSEAARIQVELSDRSELTTWDRTVEFAAGESVVSFQVAAVNDGMIDGNQTATVSVVGAGYHAASVELTIVDAGTGVAEATVEGVTVFLDANGNGNWDQHLDEPIAVTDTNGQFDFKLVGEGSYDVRVIDGQQSVRIDADQLSVTAAYQMFGAGTVASDVGVEGAFVFDGTPDRAELFDSTDRALGSSSTRTVSFWFYTYDVSERQVIYEEGNTQDGINIYLQDGRIYAGAWSESRSLRDVDWTGTWLSTDVEAGHWNHFSFVIDGNEQIVSDAVRGYLNGSLFGSGEGAQLRDRVGNLSIGDLNSDTRFHDGSTSTDGVGFIGYLDELEVSHQPLVRAEIQDLASRDLVAPN